MSTPPEEGSSQGNQTDDTSEAQNSKWWRRRPDDAMRVALVSAAISVGSLIYSAHATQVANSQQNHYQISSEERKRIDDTSREFLSAANNYHAKVISEIEKKETIRITVRHPSDRVRESLTYKNFLRRRLLVETDKKLKNEEDQRERFHTTDLTYANLPEYVAFQNAMAKVRTLNDPSMHVAANGVARSVEPLEAGSDIKVRAKDKKWDYATLAFAPSSKSIEDFQVAMAAFSIATRDATSPK